MWSNLLFSSFYALLSRNVSVTVVLNEKSVVYLEECVSHGHHCAGKSLQVLQWLIQKKKANETIVISSYNYLLEARLSKYLLL